ncbi:MAG: hypothetical protein Q7U68_00575 [Candidatus Roizmanbacteria bacterium]|nr:hypothetical protein [Candidatus Roizmanbacteria bacterium]
MRAEFTPQAEIFYKPRNRLYRLRRGSAIEIARSPRTSRVIMGVDKLGNFIYIPLPRLRLDAHSLPHLHRGTERLFNRATERNAFTTAKKRKTTTGGFAVRDTGYPPEKVGGFGSKHERRRIRQIRREKELERRLRDAGIDEHKLFLLIHSVLHNQTRFTETRPKRISPKTGGFRSSNEVRIMRKQRRRNQRFATSGTIYRY